MPAAHTSQSMATPTGDQHGNTPCGVPVRNVARPVIGRPFTVLCVSPEGLAEVSDA